MGKTCWKCKDIYPDFADTCPKCRIDLDTGENIKGDSFKNLGSRPADVYESSSKITNFTRPFCPVCNLIWGKASIGRITSCSKCKGPVILQDFNPYDKLFLGLVVIGIGGLTLLIKDIPIIWIGGFIWGISTILYAFQNWFKIKELDRTNEHKKHFSIIPFGIRSYFHQRMSEIIECSNCKQKLRVPKLKKKLNVTCPRCHNSFVLTPVPFLRRLYLSFLSFLSSPILRPK